MPRPLPLVEFPVEPIDWDALLPVRRPVHVEIGAGKGKFLIRAAAQAPHLNWVGLERRWSFLALGVERIAKRELGNAIYIRCDARQILRELIRPASVAAFHVYYPDPWWKKRHAKRRLFNPVFVADLGRGLESGGQLRVATDVRGYFEEIVETIDRSRLFETLTLSEEEWSGAGEPLTSYEAKYARQGRTSLRAAFRRGTLAAPPPEPWISHKPRGTPLAERLLQRKGA